MGYNPSIFVSVRCVKCGKPKEPEEMHSDGRNRRTNPDFIHDFCVSCAKKHQLERKRDDKRRYRKENPQKVKSHYRAWQLRRSYNITIDEFNAKLMAQGGKCAACDSADSRSYKDWHVDHDHGCCAKTPTCGKCFRGILCHKCNLMIGLSGDDPLVLAAAAGYLSKYKNREGDYR